MKNRVVVNVATGEHYMKGQRRLSTRLAELDEEYILFRDRLPDDSPAHRERPYAFKAAALAKANRCGFDQILWCDASILPLRPLEPVWAHAAEHGVWMLRNGYSNYQWTADEAYPYLFPEWFSADAERLASVEDRMELARAENRKIEHVMAGAIVVDLRHERGRAFLLEYLRLCIHTPACRGPWTNLNATHAPTRYTVPRAWRPDERECPCGPRDVLGHRHDQTVASVVAHRLGVVLTDPPVLCSYPPADRRPDPRTVIWMDGNYDAPVNW